MSNVDFEIIWRKPAAMDAPRTRYPGFKPESKLLKAGETFIKGGRPLSTDIWYERDVAMKLRDGTTIYLDIFRPPGAQNIPAILVWSPYSKLGGAQHLDDYPGRVGVPKDALSNLNKWEGPDPAEWCAHGYAIIHPDSRGVCLSEGNIPIWGTQEANDGYDVVEWIAAQDWSNGKVGMSGNSWLSIMQWFIAAKKPPHLAAITPWEGIYDGYRNNFPGGINDPNFGCSVIYHLAGQNLLEDFGAMARAQPLLTPYWQDKIARVEDIDIPTYVVASWTNFIHVPGTHQAWQRLRMKDKWLRIHNAMEWPDYYRPENVAEQRKFFDRYLKGIDNGWEKTPRVRISVLDPDREDEVGRVVPSFPLPDMQETALYLDGKAHALKDEPVAQAASLSHTPRQGEQRFTIRFEKPVELIGFMKLKLWVEAKDADDMDVFVAVEKLSKSGAVMAHRIVPMPPLMAKITRLVHRTGLVKALNLPYFSRVKGRLRVSHRELDEARSTPLQPTHLHTSQQMLKPGEIVPIEIAINPIAWKFRAGEQLRLIVAGHDLVPIPLPDVPPYQAPAHGTHILHMGGKYDSHLLVPLRPGKG